MKTPTVSILIPTYNYARYLPEAIESVLSQDLTDFELIIADDASGDDTAEVCAAYVQKDPRIRFFRHAQNLGMVENWNWCLRKATGKYIKYMLADDRFNATHALRDMVNAIEGNPEVALVCSARLLIDEASKSSGLWNPLGLKNCRLDGRNLTVRCLKQNVNLVGEPTAVLFRREDAVRGFDMSFRQLVDLEMWLHLLQKGDLFYLSKPLCCFRRHAGQQTEVNRAAGLHLRELIRLGRYMPANQVRRMHFRLMRQLQKSKLPEHHEEAAFLRKQFTFLTYAVSLLEYRITRPVYNLKKSWRKRSGSLMYRTSRVWKRVKNRSMSDRENPRLVMTLLVRDEADVIGRNIEYHLKHGVDFIIATDNGSEDGTLEILKKYESAGKLHLIEEKKQTMEQALWVNRMGYLAATEYHADMIIHCDADEFWVASCGNLKEELLRDGDVDCLKVPIWHSSLTDREGRESFPQDSSYLTVPPDGVLHGDWREYPSSYKVMFTAKRNLPQVDMGNHCLVDPGGNFKQRIATDIRVIHFGVRSRGQFYSKVRNGGSAVAANGHYNEEICNHWRTWYKLYLDGLLDEEYWKFLVPEAEQQAAVSAGRMVKIDLRNLLPDD